MADLHVKIFADGAVLSEMVRMSQNELISGFTTNPSLMKKAGVTDYVGFVHDVLKSIDKLPVSFEVFGDDIETMRKEADKIASLGDNVYVKIPVTTSAGESTAKLISELSAKGVKLNVTAIFTIEQVRTVVNALSKKTPSIVSVFAGRIADTGIDPERLMSEALAICNEKPLAELLWASTREVYNIFQADKLGIPIITVPNDLIAKLSLAGKDLEEYSLETVKDFLKDSTSLGFSIL